jgi:hypothetical protein
VNIPAVAGEEDEIPPKAGDRVYQTDFETPQSSAAWSIGPFASWEKGYEGTISLRVTVPVRLLREQELELKA